MAELNQIVSILDTAFANADYQQSSFTFDPMMQDFDYASALPQQTVNDESPELWDQLTLGPDFSQESIFDMLENYYYQIINDPQANPVIDVTPAQEKVLFSRFFFLTSFSRFLSLL
jgi:hypothetical protein